MGMLVSHLGGLHAICWLPGVEVQVVSRQSGGQ